jgi:DNA processing protein
MPEQRELLCQAWLSCSDSLSMNARQKLKERYTSAQEIFDQFPAALLELTGMKAYQELAGLREKGLEKLSEALKRYNINLTVPDDEHYPEQLQQIPDPPKLLFFRGTLKRDEPHAVAIVGSRRETRYGREQAFSIARDLAANGVTIISGLARGIDTAAHLGALEAGGRTIAVLGSGIRQIYPRENEALAEKMIMKNGAIISEFPPAADPIAYHFPIRNRLVSGLSHAVLLIEAREKSGTLITIGHALIQGREVFALPGPVDAPGSAVPNRMLREGASLITCANDILEDMGWRSASAIMQTALPLPDLTNDQRRLYDALCVEPKDFNELIELLGFPAQKINVLITELEMDGLIEALPGRMFKTTER